MPNSQVERHQNEPPGAKSEFLTEEAAKACEFVIYWCGHGRKPCRFYFKVDVFMVNFNQSHAQVITVADCDDISTTI
ncbi:hypothetical protein CFP56_037187 [Quercus suber]|uniref:Uncharacterized protein n=1 Tax=Quercus suber TaxID=58331 RepID=A0AAW0LPQ5_QUESU